MASSPIQKSLDNTSASGGGGKSSLGASPHDEPCTDKCRSKQHGLKIWEIGLNNLTSGESGVVCLWAKTCLNYGKQSDLFGRTALHSAASTGNLKAVEWLIKTQQCNINAKDYSGYTPLHRSIYFGHFHVARSLIKHGADMNTRDNEGLTPFELCQIDRPKPFVQNKGDMTELLVWGNNSNYNLGLGHQQPRLHPDCVAEFRRGDMSLKKVEMNTYHTMFLTQSGKVFASGFGKNGRLGTGEDEVVLSPSRVHLKHPCRDVAVGQDHSIFLTDTKVWTVGSNEFGQLGHSGLPTQYLKNPRTVDSLTRYGIVGIFAGNFHSGFYNNDVVLMCGLNQGQFGRGFEDQSVVPAPVKLRLSLDNVGNGPVTCVATSDFCTAVCIAERYVFVLRRNQCIKIDSKNTTANKILKIQASGDKNNIALFMLTTSGRILVWRENLGGKQGTETKGAFTRLAFGTRLLDVKDFSVSLSTLVVIANTGEAYKAGWNCSNKPSIVAKIEEKFGQVAAADFQIAVRRGRKDEETPFLALELMKAKRVPGVYTALSASSDVKGNNFSILQRHPMMDVTDIPLITEASLIKDLKVLYAESEIDDNICDVKFEINAFNTYAAHRLILASVSPVFAAILEKNLDSDIIQVTNKLFSVDPSKCASLEDPKTFRALLDMAYTRESHYTSDKFLIPCFEASQTKEGRKNAEYLNMTKELSRFKALCRTMGMLDCESLIARYIHDLDNINRGEDIHHLLRLNQYLGDPPQMAFLPEKRAIFSDVILESNDNIRFESNKCMLVARLPYFKPLFSLNWDTTLGGGGGGDTPKAKILLPFPSKAISILLDWVYTNTVQPLKDVDTELICETAACADYVMSDNLVQICECEIAGRMTLKNVVDILMFASKHNGSQLKHTCFDFISLSLTAMLENKLLEALPVPLMMELNEYYRRVQKDHLLVVRDLGRCGLPPDDAEYETALKEAPRDMLENLENIEEADQATMLLKKNQSKGGRSRVRLRSRTFSESEEQKENQDEKGGNKSLNSSVSDIMEHPTCPTSTASPPVASSSSGSRMESGNQKSAQRPKLIVPLPKNSAIPLDKDSERKKSLQLEEFPSLGAVSSSSTSLGKCHPPKTNGSPPSASPQPQPSTSKSSIGAWSTSSGGVVAVAVSSGSGKAGTASSVGAGAGASAVPATRNGATSRKKTKWRAIKSESDIVQNAPASRVDAEAGAVGGAAGGSNLTADGRDRNNPWKKQSASPEAQVAFQAIVEDEVEKKRNFQNAISKPFHLMQIEDEVIDFLTARYSSQDTFDYIEMLNVERVGSSNFSTPTWVQHPGALSASFPVQQSPSTPAST